ncbi:MAG: hypothetical protein JKX97_09085 [Candidatus Lindowbacteria bacterium]|nr:hypothetical protein [Candidatus Lindowbacteria bacterium]
MKSQDLVKQTSHPDPKFRNEAFDRIASSQNREFLPLLQELAVPEKPQMELLFSKYLANISPQESVPHLRLLLASPNSVTRKNAFRTLMNLNILFSLPVYMDLLDSNHSDTVIDTLEQLGIQKKAVGIDRMKHLLRSEDEKICSETFKAFRLINAQRSLIILEPFLKDSNPKRVVSCLVALGRMSVFTNWKLMLPLLESENSDVRTAAVLNLVRQVGTKAYPYLLSLLENDKDDEVVKIVINRLSIAPSRVIVEALVLAAASHGSPVIRRTAGWVIDEIEVELLKKSMLHMIKKSSEDVRSYILTKMAQRNLPGCGEIFVSYINPSVTPRLRISALEALGYLRDQIFLPTVAQYIKSTDPMESYVATLSAAQISRSMDDCPELSALLLDPDPKKDVQKQVVLQYMIDALTWKYDDKKLADVLRNNINSENQNIRYLSVILLGKSGRPEFVGALTSVAFHDLDEAVQEISRESLEELLKGDNSYFLDGFTREGVTMEAQSRLINLMSTLPWNKESSEQALDVFAEIKFDGFYPELYAPLERIAQKVFAKVTEDIRLHFRVEVTEGPWRLMLGRAWLNSLRDLRTRTEQEDWRVLLREKNHRLVKDIVGKALTRRAQWAVPALIDKIEQEADDDFNNQLRNAVKELMAM